MPKYYFNVLTTAGRVLDPEGSILDGIEEAYGSALEDARSMMSEAILEGKDISSRKIEICDETGKIMKIVAFKEAVTPTD